MKHLLPVACLVLLVRSAHPQSPDGFRTIENRQQGFRFYCPLSFSEVPVQPGDPVILARFVQRTRSSGERATRSVGGPEIWILSMEKQESPGTSSPTAGEEVAPDAQPEPTSQEEVLARRLTASSFEEFLQKRLSSYKVLSRGEKESRTRGRWVEYDLERRGRTMQGMDVATGLAGAWIFDLEDRYLGLLAVGSSADYPRRARSFARSGLSLEPIEVERDEDDLEAHYARNPAFKDPSFRIDRRRELVRGWQCIDTPNFLIVHHSKDAALLARIENDLETMRRHYEEVFPPVAPIEAVSVVRVCRDRKEYLHYGGAGTSAGFWNSARKELVLYNNVAGREGSRFGNRDSMIVLYHEAFHQYIFYSVGELPPHIWYNEGYGDYFSGAKIYRNGDRVAEVGPNPWRMEMIRTAVETGKHVPFDKLLRAEKPEYYARGPLYYAEGWSLVYFLNKSPAVAERQEWKKILPVYFETLKSGYAERLEKLGPDATLKDKEEAGKEARNKALEAAFDGVDVAELEEEWKGFVGRIR